MNLKKNAEYIFYAINNLSFWKPYFKKDTKNIISSKKEDAVVFYNNEDKFISIFKDYLIEKNNDGTWSVQVWQSVYSYDNGYGDSDYALVGTYKNIDDAIKTLLQLPVIDEINSMSENYYTNN